MKKTSKTKAKLTTIPVYACHDVRLTEVSVIQGRADINKDVLCRLEDNLECFTKQKFRIMPRSIIIVDSENITVPVENLIAYDFYRIKEGDQIADLVIL